MKTEIKPVISYDELLVLAHSQKKCSSYFYVLRKYKCCFTGNIKHDVSTANNIINNIKNNNTGHNVRATLGWGFDNFYGVVFNQKYLVHRSAEISKFTTRLGKDEITEIRKKFKEWIDDAKNQPTNLAVGYLECRCRLYYAFEALLESGMRIGELTQINFKSDPSHRVMQSKISGHKSVEIIINTEKTCKKREIYIPYDAYIWFTHDEKKLNKSTIEHGLVAFREWAKLPYPLTPHTLRRTKASLMHECGVDVYTISMVLGNTPKTVMNHYIISSARNFDACDIANCSVNGVVDKYNNLYFNQAYLKKRDK